MENIGPLNYMLRCTLTERSIVLIVVLSEEFVRGVWFRFVAGLVTEV